MSTTLVISDVHANLWALNAVLADAQARFPITEIWFLGDLFGYGPRPFIVWRKLLQSPPWPVVGVAGNHDWGVLGRIGNLNIPDSKARNGTRNIGHFREAAMHVIQKHRDMFANRPQVKEALSRLPAMHSPRPGIYLAHGAPANTPLSSIQQYTRYPLLSPQEMQAKFLEAAETYPEQVYLPSNPNHVLPRIFAVGQTHNQEFWVWQGAEWQEYPVETPYPLNDLKSHPILFNPGSVGFPRDPSGCPAYAVIDWQQPAISFHRVFYDTTALREAMSIAPYRNLITDTQFFIPPNCPEEQ